MCPALVLLLYWIQLLTKKICSSGSYSASWSGSGLCQAVVEYDAAIRLFGEVGDLPVFSCDLRLRGPAWHGRWWKSMGLKAISLRPDAVAYRQVGTADAFVLTKHV